MDVLIRSRKFRRYIYGIATAALSVLLVYGVIDGNQMAVAGGLFFAITGLASVNVPGEAVTADAGPQHAKS